MHFNGINRIQLDLLFRCNPGKSILLLKLIIFAFIFLLSINGCSANKYTPKDYLILKTKDNNSDGKIDLWAYKIDENRFLLKVDSDFDGNIDYCDFIKTGKYEKFESDIGCDTSVEIIEEDFPNYTIYSLDTNRDGNMDFTGKTINKIPKQIDWDINYDTKFEVNIKCSKNSFVEANVDLNSDGIIDKTFIEFKQLNSWMVKNYPFYVKNYGNMIKYIKNNTSTMGRKKKDYGDGDPCSVRKIEQGEGQF